jgi:hypothetical protein
MPDLLVRDVPDGVMAAIDVRARGLGLSRTVYMRHVPVREALVSNGEVVMEDLVWFADVFADLADGDVTRHAWRQAFDVASGVPRLGVAQWRRGHGRVLCNTIRWTYDKSGYA